MGKAHVLLCPKAGVMLLLFSATVALLLVAVHKVLSPQFLSLS